jgi:hypothetical protein
MRKRPRTKAPPARGAACALVALACLAPCVWGWEPSPGGPDHSRVEQLAREITEQSLLGDDLGPLLQALPSWVTSSAGGAERARKRLATRRLMLVERLGEVRDWRTAEVLRDEKGRFKVKVHFYEAPPEAGSKRPFRGLSFLFVRDEGRWCLTWLGFWDPETGSWDVLTGDPPRDERDR